MKTSVHARPTPLQLRFIHEFSWIRQHGKSNLIALLADLFGVSSRVIQRFRSKQRAGKYANKDISTIAILVFYKKDVVGYITFQSNKNWDDNSPLGHGLDYLLVALRANAPTGAADLFLEYLSHKLTLLNKLLNHQEHVLVLWGNRSQPQLRAALVRAGWIRGQDFDNPGCRPFMGLGPAYIKIN